MAVYFRIDSGGNSGSGVTLTVNYSDDFIGTTLTATNGTTTLTKTATSSGSVDFLLPEGGTWVVSGTVDGDTYSVEQYVEMEFEKTLESLPNGSTATPTNDIQKWLKCAQIKDKAYTTLSQVLSDTATLEALVSDSNACDYMARSTNWASGIAADANAMALIGKFDYCANKLLSNSTWGNAFASSANVSILIDTQVPTMTSDTAPSGECSAGNLYAGRYAYYAFWGLSSASQQCITTGTGEGSRITYDFKKPVACFKGEFTSYEGRVKSYKIQGSNDGTTWTDLTGTLTNYSFTITNVGIYRMYSLVPLSNATNNMVALLQFYGKTAESTMIPLVPKMTSNTTPSGEAFGSSLYASINDYYKVFDGDDSTYFVSQDASNAYIGYAFTAPKKVTRVVFKNGGSTSIVRIKNYKIQGSNTSKTSGYVDLYSGQYPNDGNHIEDVIINPSGSYTYYRVLIEQVWTSGNYIGMGELQFYTTADHATQVLFHSAAQDDLYYLDNGSPVIIAHTDDYGYAVVDRELLPEGVNLTLYSTVAKNPSSLGSPYSRVIHFSKYMTEVYMRPFNSLYWYGYGTDNWEETTPSSYGTHWSFNTNNMYGSESRAAYYAIITTKSDVVAKSNTIHLVYDNASTFTQAGYTENTSYPLYVRVGKDSGGNMSVRAFNDSVSGSNTIKSGGTGTAEITVNAIYWE